MENKSKNINIELRSEEVQELMGKIPPMILRFGIGSILSILLLFFIASFYIKYPTYETVPVKLNIGENTHEVAMPSDGIILDVRVNDGESVKTHDTLMVISCPTLVSNDTIILHSPSDGIIYSCDFLEKGMSFKQETPLFVIRKGSNGKMTGKCYVSQQIKQKIERIHLRSSLFFTNLNLLIDDIISTELHPPHTVGRHHKWYDIKSSKI